MGLFNKKTNSDSQADIAAAEEKKAVAKKEEKPESVKDLYKEEAKKEDGKKASVKTKASSNAYRVLIRPLITEKSSALVAENKYVFEVSERTNKIEVSKAIASAYGVNPVDVNIINMKGKTISRGRVKGKRKDWKKAIVTLPAGKTIQVYEGI